MEKLLSAARAAVVVATLVIACGSSATAVGSDSRSTPGVPALARQSLPAAYAELHRDGFKMTFTRSFSIDWSGVCVPVVTGSAPLAGKAVSPGSTVRVFTKLPFCALPSPGLPAPMPKPIRVPSFVGRPLSVAISWVGEHHLSWAAAIPPLTDGNAKRLYANYTITSQQPRPGAGLTVGARRFGGIVPTPLRLRVTSP